MGARRRNRILVPILFLILGIFLHETKGFEVDIAINEGFADPITEFTDKSTDFTDGSTDFTDGSTDFTDGSTDFTGGSTDFTTELSNSTTELSTSPDSSTDETATSPESTSSPDSSTVETTTSPKTTPSPLPGKEIWKQIRTELETITTTINKLKDAVNDVFAKVKGLPSFGVYLQRSLYKGIDLWSRYSQYSESFDDICTLDKDGLCLSLKKVLSSISIFSKNIPKIKEPAMSNLYDIQNDSKELSSVAEKIEKNKPFIKDNIKLEAFNKQVGELTKDIDEAKSNINNRLEEPDNTLAIVLGTLGGVLGLVLIGGGIFMILKKKKKKKQQKLSMNVRGQVNDASSDVESEKESKFD